MEEEAETRSGQWSHDNRHLQLRRAGAQHGHPRSPGVPGEGAALAGLQSPLSYQGCRLTQRRLRERG